MSDARRPSERMTDAALAIARHAARLGLGPDDELAEALPGAVAAALDERHALREEVARLRELLGRDVDDWRLGSLLRQLALAQYDLRDAEERAAAIAMCAWASDIEAALAAAEEGEDDA